MNELADLRDIQPDQRLSAKTIFGAIFAAGSVLSDDDRESDTALEIAIRLLEARRNKQVPSDCLEAIELLAEECGLYPYIDPNRFNFLTQTIIEAHSVKVREKLYLHSKQMQVLLWLLDGDNVILSAPTSFGKSLLVDAFLAMRKPSTVVVILPTIALIDESRRRLARSFGSHYQIITTVSDSYSAGQPAIFVLTQERFLQRADDIDIDLLFIDEFYKLDPDRGDTRFETLNLALYRALPRAKQCFMAGPHIRDINLGERWKGSFRFLRTDYRTVTVNVIDRSAKEERLQTFLADLRSVGDAASLIFTAAPGTAQTLMRGILDAGIRYETDLGQYLGRWIAENYHPEWPVAHGNECGIAIHHGRLPRSLGQLFVHLFNEGEIKVLVCTSTLIEGVNTSAANVFVYDKKINRADFDFFSFANIRGRVGRMMRHFVGNAFLYHEPPREIETRVEVPILSDPGTATDYLIMNVRRAELSPSGQERQRRLPIDTGLSAEILRDHGGLGVDMLTWLSDRVSGMLRDDPDTLIWKGFARKEQRISIAELALKVAHTRGDRTGIHTPKQVAWAWSQLGRIRTLPKFLRWFASTFFSDDKPEGIDCAFQFLQACEFSFPRTIAAVEALVRQATSEAEVNYGTYTSAMECWFRPAWMKELDEAGIPLPLAERLALYIGEASGRAEALKKIRALAPAQISELDSIDRYVLDLALTAE
jgi:hypothetical protein